MNGFSISAFLFFITSIAISGGAFAAGIDASQYQQQGQVMQVGTARFMQVLGARPVQVEAAPASNMQAYAGMGAGAALGGVLGNSIDNPGSAGRQIATAIGGIAGAVVGGALANPSPAIANATEVTMIDPASQQIIVIVQGGDEQFFAGEEVMVITMGANTRVTKAPPHQPKNANNKG